MAYACVRGPGHPDQVCDLVAADIVEEYLRRDQKTITNIRVCGGRGAVFVSGEVQSSADFDVASAVKRTLASLGVPDTIEPFVALEPMESAWAKPYSGRHPVSVFGYATSETADGLPRILSWVREAARELERRRTADPDWFWTGSDYAVGVKDGKTPLMSFRVQHGSAQELVFVREQLTSLFRDRFPSCLIQVNPAGEERTAGFSHRIGSSGQSDSALQYGSALPSNLSGIGFQLSHPLNAGARLARLAAKELVFAGYGKAIWLELIWEPGEAKPNFLRARNEQGKDVTQFLESARFDLGALPDSFSLPSFLHQMAREGFETPSVL